MLIIPDDLAARTDITPLAKLVYGHLNARAQENPNRSANEPVRAIALALGTSRSAAHRAIAALNAARLIRTTTEKGRTGWQTPAPSDRPDPQALIAQFSAPLVDLWTAAQAIHTIAIKLGLATEQAERKASATSASADASARAGSLLQTIPPGPGPASALDQLSHLSKISGIQFRQPQPPPSSCPGPASALDETELCSVPGETPHKIEVITPPLRIDSGAGVPVLPSAQADGVPPAGQTVPTVQQQLQQTLDAKLDAKPRDAIVGPPTRSKWDACECGHRRYSHTNGGDCTITIDQHPCPCKRWKLAHSASQGAIALHRKIEANTRPASPLNALCTCGHTARQHSPSAVCTVNACPCTQFDRFQADGPIVAQRPLMTQQVAHQLAMMCLRSRPLPCTCGHHPDGHNRLTGICQATGCTCTGYEPQPNKPGTSRKRKPRDGRTNDGCS